MENKRFLLYFFLILIVSCQQTGKENKEEEVASVILDDDIDGIDTEMGKTVYYRFPSPEDMLRYINREKLEYTPDILNPPEHSKKYIGSTSQSINLGIYISELAYVTIFRKLNQASNYLEAVNYLSDELLIAPENNSILESRVKKNLNNIDSLTIISRDAYNEMVKYLARTKNEQTLALISTGAYIEALHLSLNQIENFNADNPLIKKIFEQKSAFNNLYEYLNENAGENNSEILADLEEIRSKMDQVKIVKTSKTEVTKEDDLMVFGGGKTKIEITKSQFEEVKEAVLRIRNKLVQI